MLRQNNGSILILAWTAGCLDALSFLSLGHVFTANMTGNTVLLGLALAQRDAQSMLHSLLALLAFCLGVLSATLIVGRINERSERSQARRITIALTIEGSLLLIFALTWLLARRSASGSPVAGALIVFAALAMGQQSAIVLSLGVPGVSTTYITGTITTLVASIGRRLSLTPQTLPASTTTPVDRLHQPDSASLVAVWLIYIIAATIGGLGALYVPVLVAFLPPLALLVVIGLRAPSFG